MVKANGNGEMYIMAEALTEKVMGVGGHLTDYEIVETHPGAFFENMLADHPFLPKTSRLVLADYVTMDSGTGCVHTAPGFGADDYQTCKRYGMDMVVPVDDQGRHTDYAGKYAGMVTEESNPVILEDMKEAGALLASEEIVHSYPHCWRCKHPIIFRATPQWFCSVDAFKDEAVRRLRRGPLGPRLGQRPHEVHDPGARRLVHLPPAPVGSAHPRVLLQGLRQARRAPMRPSPPSPSCSARKAPTPGSTRRPPISCPPAMTCPHCGGKSRLREGDRHAGRLVRLRLHPLSPSMKRDQGFWPADHVSGGPRPVPRLVPVLSADRRGRLRQRVRPSRSASPTAGPWTARARPCTSPWATAWTPLRSSTSTARTCCACGRLLPTTTPDVRCSDAIFKQLSQNYLKFRNTARYCLGNLDGFDPNDLVAPAGHAGAGPLGRHPAATP